MVILLPIDSYASKGYEANADADGVALQSVCPATCKQDCSSGSTSRLQDVELSIIILLESFSSKRMHSNIFSSPSSLRINGCTPMIVFFQPQHFAPQVRGQLQATLVVIPMISSVSHFLCTQIHANTSPESM